MGVETDFFYIVGPIVAAFFFQSLMGMGGGLISIPLLSLFFSPHFVIPFVCLFQLATGFLILPARKRVDKKTVLKALPFLLIGAAVGSYFLPLINEQYLRLLLGLYIFLELLKQRVFKETFQILPTKTLIPGGALMNGMFGMGGPLFIVYLQRLNLTPQHFRATMLTLLFFANCSRIPSYIYTGQITEKILVEFVLQLPCFIIAMRLGHVLAKRLKTEFFYPVIQGVLVLAAFSLLAKAAINLL